jgi:3-mercaptopyruvate sulfurtransferase SseA
MSKGYKKVYVLKGGWNEWYYSGYPVEKKSKENRITPQVSS